MHYTKQRDLYCLLAYIQLGGDPGHQLPGTSSMQAAVPPAKRASGSATRFEGLLLCSTQYRTSRLLSLHLRPHVAGQ
jgi:hypothetical protein